MDANLYGSYLHARPDGSVFYVGKGKEKRARRLSGRTFHHSNVVKKHGAENILVGFIECSSEQIALDLEIGLIKCLKMSGVKLANITNGGEGVSGLKHSLESIEKTRAANIGRVLTEEHRKKVSEGLKKTLSSPDVRKRLSETSTRSLSTPEVKLKLSMAQKKLWSDPTERAKRINALTLALATPEARERKRIAAKECLSRPEVKAKMSTASKGRAPSDTTKLKISDTLKGHAVSEETRARISASQKIRMAKRRESRLNALTK